MLKLMTSARFCCVERVKSSEDKLVLEVAILHESCKLYAVVTSFPSLVHKLHFPKFGVHFVRKEISHRLKVIFKGDRCTQIKLHIGLERHVHPKTHEIWIAHVSDDTNP